jgi:hypothetical protein
MVGQTSLLARDFFQRIIWSLAASQSAASG